MKIIVGIDGHEQRHDALALGAELARIDEGQLVVAHVYPWTRWSEGLGNAYELTVREDAQELLAESTRELEGVTAETRAIADRSAPRALHKLAEEIGADLIVVGSSHHGPIGRTLLGSTTQRVLHGAPCPVAVAPRGMKRDADTPRRIAVGYDGSAEAGAALEWTASLAKRLGAGVTVLDVYQPVLVGLGYPGAAIPYDELDRSMREETQKELDGAVASLPPEVQVTGRLLEGPTARSLADAAEDHDLLVVGSRGYGPHGAVLLGSVAGGLAHLAPCPLVVLPRSAVEADAG